MSPASLNSRRIRRYASRRCCASHFNRNCLIRYPLGEHLRDVSYDAAGRISAYSHYIAASGATAPAQNQQFSYDSLGRLTQVSSALAIWNYSYDANGNRTSVAINSAAPSVYTLDASSNRLLQISNPANTLTYDNAGNIFTGGAYTLGYDLRGRMSSIARIGANTTYTYDNHGQRLRKHSGSAASTSVFAYDPQGQLLGEYDSAGKAIREYVWLDGMPVAMFMPDPAAGANAASSPPLVYYIHADHLNTPRVLVDKNNAMRWRWLGEPFGTTPPETSPQGLASLEFNLRYPGQFYDLESGMFYNLNRDYVPGAGRYAQSDPIGLAGGLNTYSYVENNPLSFVDPMGLWIYGTYDRSSGALSLHDLEKGTSLTGKFESGGKPFGDPIPGGSFDILARGGRDGFFRLEPVDSNYGDDKDDRTGRTRFRLHHPGRTLGCIAATDEKNWSDVERFINGTAQDRVTVPSMSRNPWAPKTESLPRYGRIVVIH